MAKLKDALTGDTLHDKGAPINYPKVELPEPSIAYAIAAKTRQDEDRMGNAVQKILEEDQSLRFYRDPATNEFLLAGTGQQHVEVVVSRLKKRYGVDVQLSAPKIPYRETIRGMADVQGRHKKQTGGHGAVRRLLDPHMLEPLPRGGKFEFANDIFGGSHPPQLHSGGGEGHYRSRGQGLSGGIPGGRFQGDRLRRLLSRCRLLGNMAFKLAAKKAFKAAMQEAKPTLLEPIMKVEGAGACRIRRRSDG